MNTARIYEYRAHIDTVRLEIVQTSWAAGAGRNGAPRAARPARHVHRRPPRPIEGTRPRLPAPTHDPLRALNLEAPGVMITA